MNPSELRSVQCFDPTVFFKPQWAYRTPAGYRDEMYLIPFTFSLLMNGSLVMNLPVQLDDDVPFILRAIVFPAVGSQVLSAGVGFPGLVRMRDSHGNPVTDGLVYTFGPWGQSGLQNENAFGFCFEPEIECAPGGTLLFDFQLSSSGFLASLLEIFGAGSLTFIAAVFGAIGNTFNIELINPGAPNVPLSVAVVGTTVEVTLATNGASVITSTLTQVANIINSTPAAAALMFAFVGGVGSTVATALASTPLAGGDNGSTFDLNGTLIGVKRWKECP